MCPCLVCYNNHRLPGPPPPPLLPVYYHLDYNDNRFSTLSKPYTRWSSEIHGPRRGVLATGGRRCRLVAGGSPFVTCCNCFELLQMPTKWTKTPQKKMRCPACSAVILLSVVDKKLVTKTTKSYNTMESPIDVSGDFDFQPLDRLPLRSQSLTSHKSTSSINTFSTSSGSLVSRQNSLKDASVANGIETSSKESVDPQNDRVGRESFFMGMIKKNFKPSGSNQHVSVTVNGHPLSERLVKKAEKLSGPIQPGNYWYDSRAGFWGMMGGPCRGIIPPLIEELNYPMAENCANGDTNIYVNGRELHEKDLDLLASRGLPTDKDRSYMIEISGRVFEEGSGNELQSLGKLAPTVESKKYGFGMKPPKLSA